MTSGFDALGTYCVPLEVGVETGVFGLAIFGLLVASTLAKAHKTFWSDLPPTSKWISAACGASLIGLMVHGLFDTVFYRPQVHFIFWLVIAMVVTQPKEERD
jgi:putative inorganic carbon (HCO3(-)) transporter